MFVQLNINYPIVVLFNNYNRYIKTINRIIMLFLDKKTNRSLNMIGWFIADTKRILL